MRRLAVLLGAFFLLAASEGFAGGAAWVREPIPAADVRTVSFHPLERGLVLAGTTSGQLYRSTDGGVSWEMPAGDLPFPGHVVARLAADPSTPGRFWVALWRLWGRGGAVAVTDDAGRSWRLAEGLPDAQFRAIAVAPSDPRVVVAGGETGVWRSTDGGGSFRHVTPGRAEWSRVESLAVDPRTSERLYAGTWRRPFRSDDGGRHWKPIWNGMVEDTDVFSLTVDRSAPDALWATTCGWVYRTEDRGGHWTRYVKGFDSRRVHAFAVGADRLFGATTLGLHVSTDAGRSWRVSGLAGRTISDVAADPFDRNRLLLAAEDDGLWRSEDGGESWLRSSDGLAGAYVLAVESRGDGGFRAAIRLGTGRALFERSEWGPWLPAADDGAGPAAERCGEAPPGEDLPPIPGLPARSLCPAPRGEAFVLTAGCGLFRRIPPQPVPPTAELAAAGAATGSDTSLPR